VEGDVDGGFGMRKCRQRENKAHQTGHADY
jgi:hypothetical protein